MRVAIVHDDLTQRGGAEQVVLSLTRLFPDADLYTSVYDRDGTFPEFASRPVRTTFLQRLPHRGASARRLLPLYPVAFDRLVLRGYDLVVSSSSRFAHGTRAPGAFHLCYCHAPARFLYQTDRYLADGGPAPSWTKPALRPLFAALRRWDRNAASRPDAYAANSRATAARIRSIYGREAVVVHPPVDTRAIAPAPNGPHPGDFYLVVARLLPYKRVDLPIRVCTRLGLPLVVVGDGPDRSRLQAMAGATVRFAGKVPGSELVSLLHGCRALLQAGEEDFGFMPLEANAAGRPVAAFAAGGALETVVDGETGVLFSEQDEYALEGALQRIEQREWPQAGLRQHAERFDEATFHAVLIDVLRRLRGS